MLPFAVRHHRVVGQHFGAGYLAVHGGGPMSTPDILLIDHMHVIFMCLPHAIHTYSLPRGSSPVAQAKAIATSATKVPRFVMKVSLIAGLQDSKSFRTASVESLHSITW
jgi:hypothetical protein